MKRTLILAAALIGSGAIVAAQSVSPDDVAYDEYGTIAVSLSGVAGDPAAGAEVMSQRGMGNCVACHQVSALSAAFQGNVGPSLDGAGDRWTEAELRGIVANAKLTFPESMMPSFYKVSGFIRAGNAYTGKAAGDDFASLLTAQQIEDVVAYLATLKE
jgi:sulfur-oxidizing protein SoxX